MLLFAKAKQGCGKVGKHPWGAGAGEFIGAAGLGCGCMRGVVCCCNCCACTAAGELDATAGAAPAGWLQAPEQGENATHIPESYDPSPTSQIAA